MGLRDEIIDTVIRGVGDAGGTGDVMLALGYDQNDFQTGFDIANNIQNLDLVKLLYSNFNQNRIIVEFTIPGKERYENLINKQSANQ